MKAKLEFNLPEEKKDFTLASRGWEWANALWELDQKLRAYQKYDHQLKTVDEAIEEIRNYLHEFMEENGISFDDMN